MPALIDVEVYNSAGAKVFQMWWDNQAFTAGQTRTYTTKWQVPATESADTYTVKIGAFKTGWGDLYFWNDDAAQVVVS